jgi:serine/threonine-protein kinase
MSEAPRPLTAERRSVPAHVEAAVLRALEKLPADRFNSAQQFGEALTNPGFATSTTFGSRTRTARESKLAGLLYLAATIIVLLSGVAVWEWLRPKPLQPVARYSLAFDPNEALDTAASGIDLSPDGSTLAYFGGPNKQLMLRPRNQLHAMAVPYSDDGAQPFFSPDGTHVGFTRGASTLLIASMSGGPLVMVTDSLRRGSPTASANGAGGSWGRDGFIYAGLWGGGLVRVEAKPGATPTTFTHLDTASDELEHYLPQVLPGARGVIFTVGYHHGPAAIAVADIPSGKHHVILKGVFRARYLTSGHLLYVTLAYALMVVPFDLSNHKIAGDAVALTEGLEVPAQLTGSVGFDVAASQTGTLMYATKASGNGMELVWVTRNEKIQEVDSTFRGSFGAPSISPDGRQVALSVWQEHPGGNEIWIKPLDHGPSRRLGFEGADNENPAWTPNGQAISFYSNALGRRGLWMQSVDGLIRKDLQITQKTDAIESLWSPDGRWLIFTSNSRLGGALDDLVATQPSSPATRQVLVATKSWQESPTISPDGRFLAFNGNESGRSEVYVVPFPNAATRKWKVSAEGGTEPRWSHSGKEIFFRDGSGNMVSVQVNTTPTFSIIGSSLLFPARKFVSWQWARQYDVSRDDRRFLMFREVTDNRRQLVVVENFFDELTSKPSAH